MQMNGLAHKTGWRWIFIMEGIVSPTMTSLPLFVPTHPNRCSRSLSPQLSCLVAIVGAFLLVDFPEKAHKSWKFLTEAECAYIIRRVNKDRGDAFLEPFTLGRFLRPALDFKIWGFALIFLYVLLPLSTALETHH